ncbi:MAG TPA: FkbM family methyltransferase [Gemmatimonadota bacterium]|nr:FkbM family methyltransferase [Gemmatimonadota bacterium]
MSRLLSLRHFLKRLLTPVTLRVRGGPLKGLRWSPASGSRFVRGDYESYNVPAFLEAVNRGEVVYDVGAHVGYFTAIASLRVGPAGRVVAFEPRPVNLGLLRRHVEANRLENVTVVDAGVGRESGEAHFEEGTGSGTGKISRTGRLTVRVVRLDDVVGQEGFPPPDFIKIDVEGGELDVLEGARHLLERGRPRLLVGIHGPEMRRECTALLEELGYELRTLRESDDAGNTDILARPVGSGT